MRMNGLALIGRVPRDQSGGNGVDKRVSASKSGAAHAPSTRPALDWGAKEVCGTVVLVVH